MGRARAGGGRRNANERGRGGDVFPLWGRYSEEAREMLIKSDSSLCTPSRKRPGHQDRPRTLYLGSPNARNSSFSSHQISDARCPVQGPTPNLIASCMATKDLGTNRSHQSNPTQPNPEAVIFERKSCYWPRRTPCSVLMLDLAHPHSIIAKGVRAKDEQFVFQHRVVALHAHTPMTGASLLRNPRSHGPGTGASKVEMPSSRAVISRNRKGSSSTWAKVALPYCR